MTAPPSSLSLDSIRSALIRQEDTIIFALIERAQHRQNASCYERGSANSYAVLAGKGASLLDFMLLETERLHARVRRYTSPDEHAFFPHRLPAPQLPMIDFEPVLHPCIVNLNGEIMDMYLSRVVPGLCGPGDDQQHGSSVVADIAALQAISKRVHYGFYVAESKFRAQPEQYTRLIEAGDEEGIMELLTNAAVEQRVLQRVRLKASTFGQEIEAPVSPSASPSDPSIAASQTAGSSGGGSAARIDPDQIVAMYRDYVIPLTKVAEVQYLLQRLSSQQIAHHGAAGSACHKGTVHRFVRSCPKGKAAPLLIRCSNVADVFGAVMANRATFGMVLLEQGDSGVLAVTRSLLRESSLRVVGEVVQKWTRCGFVNEPEAPGAAVSMPSLGRAPSTVASALDSSASIAPSCSASCATCEAEAEADAGCSQRVKSTCQSHAKHTSSGGLGDVFRSSGCSRTGGAAAQDLHTTFLASDGSNSKTACGSLTLGGSRLAIACRTCCSLASCGASLALDAKT